MVTVLEMHVFYTSTVHFTCLFLLSVLRLSGYIDIPEELITDCVQLVKANSILVKRSITVVSDGVLEM